jgi:predicted heme/steroid binding protein
MLPTIEESELRAHNGAGGTRRWIALAGIVYDVTDCPKWRTGLHEEMHFPGLDLSGELPDAPHGTEVLDRRCVKPVGRLLSPAKGQANQGEA